MDSDTLDYYLIGQRIRKFRKANSFSQEQLAEKVGISTTHLSHIETGNTKLSLSVFVSIAEALLVKADELLYDTSRLDKSTTKNEIIEVLESCTTRELLIILDIIKTTKISLDKYSE